MRTLILVLVFQCSTRLATCNFSENELIAKFARVSTSLKLPGIQSTRDKSRSFKSRTRDKSRSFCPGHPNNEKTTMWFVDTKMLESPNFFHFSSQNQDNKALPPANLAGSWLLRVRSDRDTADYTNRRSKSPTKYAPIADHNRVHKDVSHALAVSHAVGLQDSVRDLSRVDCTASGPDCDIMPAYSCH